MTEYIELSPGRRIVVENDEDAESPREWNLDAVSVHPINLNSRYYPPAPGTDSHGPELDAIIEATGQPYLTGGRSGWKYTEEMREAIRVHFERAGLPFRMADLNADRDWVGLFIWYLEPGELAENMRLSGGTWDAQAFLSAEVAQYKQYAAGEVYVLVIQELRTYAKQRASRTAAGFEVDLTENPTLLDEWVTVDSVAGVYLDSYSDEDVIAAAVDAGLIEQSEVGA